MGSASTRAKNKYNAANYERIYIMVAKGQKDKIKAHADSMGESVNGFVNRAVDETIQRDTGHLNNKKSAPPVIQKPVNTDSETELARKALLDKLKNL